MRKNDKGNKGWEERSSKECNDDESRTRKTEGMEARREGGRKEMMTGQGKWMKGGM